MRKVLPLIVAASMMLSTATSFAAANGDTTAKFLEKKFHMTDSSKEFKTLKTQMDELGYKHVKVEQIVNSIPVYGNQYMVHYDASGSVYASDGKYDEKAKAVKVLATLTSKDAVKAAKAAVNYTEVAPTQQLRPDRFDAELYLVEVNGEYTPCYVVKASWLHDNTFGNYVVFINADSGEVVRQYDNTQYTSAIGTGIGVLGDSKSIYTDYTGGTYYLRDFYRTAQTTTYDAKNGTYNLYYMTDADNNWNATTHKPAVDAHYYIGKTVDYYKNILNWSGMDGNNISNRAVVHYSTNYVNAFWDGTYLVFGDGDGVQCLALSGACDIVAHEFNHGVNDKVSGLEYSSDSGAISEAIADIMAVAVEKYVQPTKWDWVIGEDVWTPGIPGDAMRSVSNPPEYGDPDHYSDRYIGTDDNGGVHKNSGIIRKVAYLIGSNPAVGVDGMAKIFHRANCYYFVPTETFFQVREHTLQATADLYGYGSTAYNVVKAAWDHVGIYQSGGVSY